MHGHLGTAFSATDHQLVVSRVSGGPLIVGSANGANLNGYPYGYAVSSPGNDPGQQHDHRQSRLRGHSYRRVVGVPVQATPETSPPDVMICRGASKRSDINDANRLSSS